MGKGGNNSWLLPLFFLVKSELGGTTVSIEKKSLVGKQAPAAPSNKKKSSAKAKVDTAKPASSKVVAAFKAFP
jgi:hypothetical protein